MDTKLTMYWILALIVQLVCISKAHGQIYDSNCGKTKGCFTDGKQFMVTWENKGSNIDFSLTVAGYYYLNGGNYLAVAFSDDRRMGDDSVVACMYDNNNGNYTAESSYNSGTDNDVLSPPTYGISYVASITNGCTFTRQLGNNSADSRFFDLTNNYYIQLVTGKVKYKHGNHELDKHDDIPWISERKVNFQANEVVGPYKMNSPLVKVHGSIMVFAWLLFSCVGIMTARYNKDMMPGTKLFGTKVWFQVHRALMVAVLLCVVVGFITIFVEIGGYSQITPGEYAFVKAHPVIGIIITCLVILNPIGALFRPGADHKYRWVFNWCHLGVGAICQLLAVMTIFFGFYSDRTGLSNSPAFITAAYVAVFIFVFVFLEIRKKTEAGRQEQASINNNGVALESYGSTDKKENKQNASYHTLIVYVVHILLNVGFCIGIVCLINAT